MVNAGSPCQGTFKFASHRIAFIVFTPGKTINSLTSTNTSNHSVLTGSICAGRKKLHLSLSESSNTVTRSAKT